MIRTRARRWLFGLDSWQRAVREAAVLAVGLAAVPGCSSSSEPAKSPEQLALTANVRVERQLTGGQPYEAAFELPGDQFLELAVHQHGIDVVVFLYDPDDDLVFEVDGPEGSEGTEVVEVVAEETGVYRLRVEPLSPGGDGPFTLEVLRHRPATPEDRVRATAAAALARADRRRLAEQYEEAVDSYRRALPLLEDAGEPSAEAQWHYGEVLIETGRLRQARQPLEAAASAYNARGDRLGEARVLNDLGGLHRKMGETWRALEAHRRSLDLYRELKVEAGEASALNNLGLVLETLGDLEGAAVRYRESLAIWHRLERSAAAATTLQNLGRLYNLIGRDQEALDYLREAVERLSAPGQERRRLSALIALGWGHYLAGRPEEALELYDQALALATRLGDRLAEAAVFDREGTAYRVLGRREEATEAYERALERVRQAGSQLSEGHTLANLGWLELETGDIKSAERRLRRAVRTLREVGDPNGEVYARVGLAQGLRQQGDLHTARQELEEALGLVETVRSEVPGGLSRSYFLAVRYDLFEALIGVLMELHRVEENDRYIRRGLEVAELSRARGLLEALQPEEGAEGLSQEAAARRRDSLAEIRALEERRLDLVAEGPGSERLQALEKALRRRWLEVEHLDATNRGEGEHPAEAGPFLLTAKGIQDFLDEETLLLVYFLAEPESYLWSVDRQHIAAHRLPGRERIETLARQTASLLARSREVALRDHAESAAEHLAEVLMAPAAERIAGWKRLAVMVDGGLHYVPFAALPGPAPSAPGGRDLLLEHHEIVAVPSVSVLARQRRVLGGRKPATKLVAVLADPVFNAADERASGAPARTTELPEDLERTLGELQLDRLQRLPFTAREGEVITALAPEGQSLLAEGHSANRELVESGVLRDYGYLHFATHGLLHPVHPGLSGVVLSLLDRGGEPQDGFLRAHEVAALDLSAELVVLSACQTGLGSAIRGEGLVGLPHAFFQAGARRVVVSHWNVNDRATAELMERFYGGLLVDGLPAAAALRAAQLSLRSEKGWSIPYYWAAFSLQGDWR